MSQQQWQPPWPPGPAGPPQDNPWAAPHQGQQRGQQWAPPAQNAQWGPPSGQPWSGGHQPFQGGYLSPGPGPGSWGPPSGAPQPGQFTRPAGASSKKPNPLRYVLGLAVVVAILALGGFVIGSLLHGGSQDVAYQNEDYSVPAVEASPPDLPTPPQTYDEAELIVTSNPLYAQTVANPVRCVLEDVGDQTTSAGLETALNNYMECQLRVWGPPIEGAGFTAVRPSVTVYSDQVVSACGSMKGDKAVNAFYCPADQRVFYSTLLSDALPIASRPRIIELILAHEFGHAVQGRTGIIVTGQLLAANSDSKGESLEWQRRIETQADCMSGMFMRSVATSLNLGPTDYANFKLAWEQFGDNALSQSPEAGNHGTGASRQLWGTRGLNTADIGTCNTFTAPSKEVR